MFVILYTHFFVDKLYYIVAYFTIQEYRFCLAECYCVSNSQKSFLDTGLGNIGMDHFAWNVLTLLLKCAKTCTNVFQIC